MGHKILKATFLYQLVKYFKHMARLQVIIRGQVAADTDVATHLWFFSHSATNNHKLIPLFS